MNPASAQHAALRILLEDVEPLLLQAQEMSTTLGSVREELHSDLERLGALVQRSLDAQPALLETGRRLASAAARIEAALAPQHVPAAARSSTATGVRAMLGACLASALMSASLVTAALWFAGSEVREQARIGRALQLAWPSLDGGTRAKVQELIDR